MHDAIMREHREQETCKSEHNDRNTAFSTKRRGIASRRPDYVCIRHFLTPLQSRPAQDMSGQTSSCSATIHNIEYLQQR